MRKFTVLVVDDEEDVRTLCSVMLGLEGMDTVEAQNGDHALRMLGSTRPDVIVLDLMMPVMSGLECLSALKANRELAQIPVLILTARTSEEDRTRAMAAGALAVITKPFDPSLLIERVREAVCVA